MASDDGSIRIVRKKIIHGGHHGGAWKVAYADFVTAMMAFFLVMWILGLSKPVREAIASYFKNPGGVMQQGTPHTVFTESGAQSHSGIEIAPSMPAHGTGAQAKSDFRVTQQKILDELKKRPELASLQDSIQMQVTDQGLRIELIEKTHSLFFNSGSSKLQHRTIELLQIIGKQLGALGKPIVVEGHTDAKPLGGPGGYSNWELSSDRANAARRILELSGVSPKQIIGVRGYAATHLLRPDDPYHFSNRRVSIMVAYDSKND